MEFKNRRISVSVTKTMGQENYSSIKWNAGISADIPDGEDLQKAYDELYDLCTDQIEDYYKCCIK